MRQFDFPDQRLCIQLQQPSVITHKTTDKHRTGKPVVRVRFQRFDLSRRQF